VILICIPNLTLRLHHPRLHKNSLADHFFNYIANESGVDKSVESKFPSASVTYGSAASGAGDNREIRMGERPWHFA
jgi:hypothetical protein